MDQNDQGLPKLWEVGHRCFARILMCLQILKQGEESGVYRSDNGGKT